MESLKNRRKIINRQELQLALEALWDDKDLTPQKRRQQWLGLYKEALKKGYAEVERRFIVDQDGAKAVMGNAFVMDQVIRILYDVTTKYLYPSSSPTMSETVCIVAVGGYGRGEMSPQSDVDLLFLHDYKISPRVEQIVEEMLYMLWDMGLKVGQSTRSIDECVKQAKADWTICTSMLESRYIWGEKKLYTKMARAFDKQVMNGNEKKFMAAKLDERDERHKKMGDTRYVLEPNIKEGKGGLRDLHALYWITKSLYKVKDISELVLQKKLTQKEVDRFKKAQQYLWTLRCHLHYLTKRSEDRLTFDVQPELALRMGYKNHAGASGVERFMKHYFLVAKEVGDLTRIFLSAFEASAQKRRVLGVPLNMFKKEVEGFKIDTGRLAVASGKVLEENPIDMLRIFRVFQQTDYDIHPRTIRSITRRLKVINKDLQNDPEANRIFLEILTAKENPEVTLRMMNECGVLGRFLPDFGRVVAQMQYDMYHVYTTDEHTIRAIGIMNMIEQGELVDDHPVASKIFDKVISKDALYVAVLLHDIAKGRGGDHSVLGAEVAKEVCPRLGLNEEQTQTVIWLVREHLLMSNTAFKRDLDDPKTIEDFASKVQSLERLRLLLCLTVVDIRAVGPNVWNNWKATLLRDLYNRTEDILSGGLETEGRDKRIEGAKAALAEKLNHWPEEYRKEYLNYGVDSYYLSYRTDELARQAEIVKEAEDHESPLTFRVSVDEENAVTIVTVFAGDHPGLFSRLAGAMAVSGATILNARIHTFTHGMALDNFWVQDLDGQAFSEPRKIVRLEETIRRVLSGELRPLEELGRRAKNALKDRRDIFTVPPRVLIDNKGSETFTIIEVNGRDRAGILFDLTSAITRLGLQIRKSKISTFGEEVVDVFYVKDVFGMKIEHKGKLDQIRETLLDVLEPDRKNDASKQLAS
ncbi:[protein-PII] uridylyltransferase [Curvivirga aplysinae]|uniref:[protein-PII] uridylyltransferase n=1 Tax=Curvivirga aplysinae TaxID=2529852 RepID=UPI0012BBAF0C|nr:[protein-PII] uridylyltransferase [Curvivirga aplysinae]MTI10292.1 [protein-PII] uridylyltransferase [Curvivirga aplysinae]